MNASRSKGKKHVHHGKTPAAWTSSLLALIGFLIGSIGFVFGPEGIPSINMPFVIIGAVLLLAAPVVGGIMNKVGLGQD